MVKGFLSYSRDSNRSQSGSDGVVDYIYEYFFNTLNVAFEGDVDITFDKKIRLDGKLSPALLKEINSSDFYLIVLSNKYFDDDRTSLSEFNAIKNNLDDDASKPFVLIELHQLTDRSEANISYSSAFDDEPRRDLTHVAKSGMSGSKLREMIGDALQPETDRLVTLLKRDSDLLSPSKNDMPNDQIMSKGIERELNEIRHLVEASSEHDEFRTPLIKNIIDAVREEIEAINNPIYTHNLGVERSFINRSVPIFQRANRIFAISLDSASSFWLSDSTKSTAIEYTKQQSKKTYRLFVFSTPESMLNHRWVLDGHAKIYGTSGKVMMTSIDAWANYLKSRTKSKRPHYLTEDFGILEYSVTQKKILAQLGNSKLTFREIKTPEDLDGVVDIRDDFLMLPETINRPVEHEPHSFCVLKPSEASGAQFWLWDDRFADDDPKYWYSCVSDVFGGDIDFGAKYTADVIHSVLISPPAHRSDAEVIDAIRDAINGVLRMTDATGERLVKSIWFGRSTDEAVDKPIRDGKLGSPLDMNKAFHAKWRWCLTMSFESEKARDQYYENIEHGEVRKNLYSFLDQTAAQLYEDAESIVGDDAAKERIGRVIEQIISQHIMRMDYFVPSPFVVYSAIKPPSFNVLDEN